jgi:hypothetical protein
LDLEGPIWECQMLEQSVKPSEELRVKQKDILQSLFCFDPFLHIGDEALRKR